VLFKLLVKAGIDQTGHLKVLLAPAQQQMLDSGLFSCLQRLMEATAQQLEHCTAAAAATASPADNSGPGFTAAADASTAAASAASSMPIPPDAASSTPSGADVAGLQFAAGKLLQVYVVMHDFFSVYDDIVEWMDTSQAPATHLMTAAMQYIGPALQQNQQQQHQQSTVLPDSLARLAYWVAESTAVASYSARLYKESPELPKVLLGRGPHIVVWSDITLVLATYATILQQQGQLPGLKSTTDFPPAAAAAAAGAGGLGSGSSSSGGSSQQQLEWYRPVLAATLARVAAGPPDDLATALAAWQQVQDQWGCIPASHRQLLQLLGVSPQAALWLAAIMPKLIYPVPPIADCLLWNPHNMVTAAGAPLVLPGAVTTSSMAASPAVLQLQKQVQQRANTPLRELLQLLLLYAATHAYPDDEFFIHHGYDVIVATKRFMRRHSEAQIAAASGPRAQQQLTPGQTATPIFSPTVQHDMLLLWMQLLQRLQRLRETKCPATSPPPQAAAAAAPGSAFPYAINWSTRISSAEVSAINAVLLLPACVHIGRPPQLPVVSRAAAAAAPAAAAAAPAAAAAAAAGNSAVQGPYVAFSQVPAGFPEQGSALMGVIECHLRSQGTSSLCDPQDNPVTIPGTLSGFQMATHFAGYCCSEPNAPAGPPRVLLILAMDGSQEPRVAFFNLLVTLLKVSATRLLSCTDVGYQLKLMVAEAAVMLLLVAPGGSRTTTAAAGSNRASTSNSSSDARHSSCSTDMSAALWLMLLGRVCLRWAVELRAMEAFSTPRPAASPAAAAGHRPQLLQIADLVMDNFDKGCSISAGLTAAGYDMGSVLQGFEALAACKPDEIRAAGADSHIKALTAVGSACSVFAVPHCCNNPGCGNVAQATELSLVSGTSCICGGCKVARYCGWGCQKAHWKQHKPVCKMLQDDSPQHR
jgi:hypothetical protein